MATIDWCTTHKEQVKPDERRCLTGLDWRVGCDVIKMRLIPAIIKPPLYAIPNPDAWWKPVRELVDRGTLIPVFPCEHGHIDPHRYRVSKTVVDGGVMRDCPGAGLEVSDGND